LDVVKELQKIQKFEDRPIEVEALLVDLELAKLFTHSFRRVKWRSANGNNEGS
jgi:hypothetical protein